MGTKRKTLRGKRSTQRKQKRFLGGVVWPSLTYTPAEWDKFSDDEQQQATELLKEYNEMKQTQHEINEAYASSGNIDKPTLKKKLAEYKQKLTKINAKMSKMNKDKINIRMPKEIFEKAIGQVNAAEQALNQVQDDARYKPNEYQKQLYEIWGKAKLQDFMKKNPNASPKKIDDYLDYLEKTFREMNHVPQLPPISPPPLPLPPGPSAPLPLPPGPSAPLPLPPGPSAPKPIDYPVNKGLLYENRQRKLARQEQDNQMEKFIHDNYGYKPKASEMKIILDYLAGNESLRNNEALSKLLEHMDKPKQKVGNDVPKTSPRSSPAMSALTQSTPTQKTKPMTIMKEKQRMHRVKSEPMSPPSTPTSLLTQAPSPKQKQTIKPSDENDMSPLTQATPTSAKTKQYDAEHAPPPPLYDADHPAPPPPSIQKTAMPKTLLQQIQQTPRLKQKTITKSSVVPVSGNTMLKHTLLERATQRRKQISPGSVSSDSTWKSGGSKRKTQRK